jgi:hypothetical protein
MSVDREIDPQETASRFDNDASALLQFQTGQTIDAPLVLELDHRRRRDPPNATACSMGCGGELRSAVGTAEARRHAD